MKGLPRSLSRGSKLLQTAIKQRLLIDLLIDPVDGATGIGWGTAPLPVVFPEGNILVLGLLAYLTVTKLTANITADFDGDIAIGTTPADDATISGTDEDFLVETGLGAATAGVSPTKRIVNAAQQIIDNTEGTGTFNVNVLIDDAEIDADDQQVQVTGVFHLVYTVLGDD